MASILDRRDRLTVIRAPPAIGRSKVQPTPRLEHGYKDVERVRVAHDMFKRFKADHLVELSTDGRQIEYVENAELTSVGSDSEELSEFLTAQEPFCVTVNTENTITLPQCRERKSSVAAPHFKRRNVAG